MRKLKEQILKKLSLINDPDLNQDIVSLGFIKNLTIDNGKVSLSIELTTPACPVKENFRKQAEDLVQVIPGVEKVEVKMTAQKKIETSLKKSGLSHVGSILAIASCKGGVGKSTLVSMIACEVAAQGFKVGLLDLDIFGPSLPTLFNRYLQEIKSQDQKLIPISGPNGLKLMSFGFLLGDSPAIMRGAMVSNYITQLLFKVDWGELDYLFIDLPPGTGDTQLTVSQSIPLSGAIMVTTNQALSLVDVTRGILMFEKVKVPMLGIIQNMAYFNCDKCGEKHYPFGNQDDTLTKKFGIKSILSLPFLSKDEMNYENYKSFPLAKTLVDKLIRELGKKQKEEIKLPKIKIEEKVLKLEWENEFKKIVKNYKIDFFTLRANCVCAICQDEFTRERNLNTQKINKNVFPVEVKPLGNYALSIHWNDGHTSGIYSYQLIESLSKKSVRSS